MATAAINSFFEGYKGMSDVLNYNEQQKTEMQTKQVKLEEEKAKLQSTLQSAKDAGMERQDAEEYYKDPANATKPVPDQLKDLASRMMKKGDLSGGVKLINAAESAESKEVLALERKMKTNELGRNEATRIIESLPDNPTKEDWDRIRMDANTSGVSASYEKEFEAMYKRNNGDIAKTKKEFRDSLKSAAERSADEKTRHDAVVEEQNNKRLENQHIQVMAAMQRSEAQMSHQNALLKASGDKTAQQEAKAIQSGQKVFSSRYDKAYERYQTAYRLADNQPNPVQAAKDARTIYESEVDSIAGDVEDFNLRYPDANLPVKRVGDNTSNTSKPSTQESKPLTPDAFNKKWATLKPGETLTGPDGKTYTKKGN